MVDCPDACGDEFGGCQTVENTTLSLPLSPPPLPPSPPQPPPLPPPQAPPPPTQLIISYLFFPLGGLGLLALVYLVARRVNCLLSCKMPSPAEAIDAHAVEVDVETAAVPTAGGSMDAAIPHMSTKTLELVTKSAKEELGITLELLVGRFGLEVCCLSITEGSLFATSGFLAKDRLVAINGQPVPPNPQAAIAMVKAIRMPGTIRIEVAREWATERAELVKCAEHHNEQLATQAEAMRALKAEIEELPALEKAAVEATDYMRQHV